MRRIAFFALGSLLALTSAAPAQVLVRVPFVSVQAGPGGTYVRAPFVAVDVNGRYPAPPPQAIIVQPSVQAQVLPAPSVAPAPTPGPALVKVPTLSEFAASFVPRPGTHEVTVLHPVSGKPVTVAFTLPDGSPRKVIVSKRELEFDYGRNSVLIRFMIGGRVQVKS